MADWSLSILIGKCRKAIDDIASSVDVFVQGVDAELAQALEYAAVQLSMSLPEDWLLPSAVTISEVSSIPSTRPAAGQHYKDDLGRGYIVLPEDYLRLLSLKLSSWPLSLNALTAVESDVFKRQATPWGWGTPEKPVAIVEKNRFGQDVLMYWTAASKSDSVEKCLYIPRPSLYSSSGADVLQSSLRAEAEMLLVYRACGLFLEGRKEGAVAERMYALSRVVDVKEA